MKPSLKPKQTQTHLLAVITALCLFLPMTTSGGRAAMPPPLADSAVEPVRYVGKEQPDKRFYDGALRHAVGVRAYQALRANRACPPEGGAMGWTYNHQPYLAYWRDRFYLQYLSTPKSEHVPPGRTLLMTSTDGENWSNPQVIFPEYALPEIKNADGYLPAGTPAIMHQRMGFYVAPNGRFLTLGFSSFCIDPLPQKGPNKGQGLGRVVREVRADNTLGPIYFIRYNRHAGWDETNTRNNRFPLVVMTSDDCRDSADMLCLHGEVPPRRFAGLSKNAGP